MQKKQEQSSTKVKYDSNAQNEEMNDEYRFHSDNAEKEKFQKEQQRAKRLLNARKAIFQEERPQKTSGSQSTGNRIIFIVPVLILLWLFYRYLQSHH